MAIHKILVEVSEQNPTHPTQVQQGQNATEPAQPPRITNGDTSKGELIKGAAYFNMGRNLVLGSVARIGEATGDYYTQRKINNLLSGSSYVYAIATGGMLGLAYTAVDIGTKVFDYQLQVAKADINTELYRERVGISSISGSRYQGRKV